MALTKRGKLYEAVRDEDWGRTGELLADGARANKKTLDLVVKSYDLIWFDKLLDPALSALYPDREMTKDEQLYTAVLRGDRKQARELIDAKAIPTDKALRVAAAYLDEDWNEMLAKAAAAPQPKPEPKLIKRKPAAPRGWHAES